MQSKRLVLSTLLLSFAASVYAQTDNTLKLHPDSSLKLNEVIIKENRIQLPFSQQNRNIWIIDKEKIKSLPARSVSELLSYVSGIDVRQRGPAGSQADISIDGGTFDQTLVLINGVKVSDPQSGHNMMNLPITMDDIDHIEVLRGSASRIYGLNALTGAINIITRIPQKTGVSANVFSGSSFKKKEEANGSTYANYGVHVSGSVALDKSSHLLSVGQEAGNGYRYNTAFKNQKVYYQGQVQVGKTDRLDVMAGYIFNNFGANNFYASPGDRESEETVKTLLSSVGYTTQITDSWTMVPRISFRHNDDDYLYNKLTPNVSHNQHKTNVVNAELNNTIKTEIGTFGVGLEARNDAIKSNNLGKRDRNNIGLSGEYKFEPVSRLLINLGVYTNYNSDYGWQAFPGLDAGYNFYGNWRVFANLGTGQRLPTYTDLYYSSKSNIGNDQLRAEKSRFAESGIKFNNDEISLSASYFVRRVSQFIDWVRESEDDPYQPNNFGQVNTTGITINADYKLKNLAATDAVSSLRLGTSYTNLDPTYKTTVARAKYSRYALESLRNQLSGTVNAEFYNLIALTLTTRYNQRINYKDYTVMDARLAFKQKKYSIYADGANLFNVQYIEAGAVPMPGSWFTLGVKAGI